MTATALFYLVCIVGACTLTRGFFALIDYIERPERRRRRCSVGKYADG